MRIRGEEARHTAVLIGASQITPRWTATQRRSVEERERMEKYFGNAYRGDPGVPHADQERFVNIWIGSAAFSALTWFSPYMWQLSNQFKYFPLQFYSFLLTFSCGVKTFIPSVESANGLEF